ncbi:hypothetical protein, variant 3 [Aphanomyces astaci]|uniref:EIPR1-like beta-propeller domain-containing protein n=1 Tax=Aphanomyces astaci TaxID=112090 RepID=W4FGG3_APHAT|nr:hypothetical protein, variant 3 [Aphanomyces astaci]ETV65843.1 hypothetical protein, variant 3 [Aphanomyces astaci]|eukprot:XP_009844704.1 hypothetical protein, variant 3 [Aphanomyces astaci]
MFGTVLTHEVKRIARSVDAVYGDSDQQRYVLGSCTPSSKKLNQLQLLDANLSVLQTYAHANPVQHLAMCPLPKMAHHVLTTFVSERNEPSFAVWDMDNVESPPSTSPGAVSQLGLLAHVTTESAIVRAIWNPTEDGNSATIASLNATSISTWTLADGGSGKEVAKLGLGEGHNQLNAIAWDPHHRQQVSATVDESIVTWDVRSGKIAHKVHQAHFQCTRDIDYNPNKPYYMASGGDDGLVKFWDIRKPKAALLTLPSHSHWYISIYIYIYTCPDILDDINVYIYIYIYDVIRLVLATYVSPLCMYLHSAGSIPSIRSFYITGRGIPIYIRRIYCIYVCE